MEIVLLYQEIPCIEILHLTKEEEKKYNDFCSSEEFDGDDFPVVDEIVLDRHIEINELAPVYSVCDSERGIPVYDEDHQLVPLMHL